VCHHRVDRRRIYMYIYLYIFIYICACVCVCACVRAYKLRVNPFYFHIRSSSFPRSRRVSPLRRLTRFGLTRYIYIYIYIYIYLIRLREGFIRVCTCPFLFCLHRSLFFFAVQTSRGANLRRYRVERRASRRWILGQFCAHPRN